LDNAQAHGPISWWSWRPGIQPRNALLLGVPLTLITLLMVLLGMFTLIAGLEDSTSPPLHVPGTVLDHKAGTQVSAPQLILALRGPKSIPGTVTIAVSQSTFQLVIIKAPVIVSYSPRLHFVYALEYAGHVYPLPGTTAAGNPFGSLALLLVGLLLLPYPALLMHWGWQDLLLERYQRAKMAHMTARVVDKRATAQTRTARPGFTGRGSRPWYGLALLPLDENGAEHIITFSVSEEVWARTKVDTRVKVTYSPHLRYMYAVHREDGGNADT
jgi:hypothetical protein